MARTPNKTAIHEAGHAVMAIREGRPFHSVVIERTEDTAGCTKLISTNPGDDEGVRILLAGLMAHRLCITRWNPRLFDRARDDLGGVAQFFREGRQADRLLKWNIEETRERLTSYWTAVEVVALVLWREKYVDHGDAVRLTEQALSRPRSTPPGRVTDWTPLADHVRFRMKWPGLCR